MPWSSAAMLAGGLVLCWGPVWAGLALVVLSIVGAIASVAITSRAIDSEEAKRDRTVRIQRRVH